MYQYCIETPISLFSRVGLPALAAAPGQPQTSDFFFFFFFSGGPLDPVYAGGPCEVFPKGYLITRHR